MGKIAIAGGSAGLGRSIADVLESTKTYEYIIPTRRSSGSETRVVDYGGIEALATLLEHEQIDTVISTLAMNDDQAGQAQLNLIEAANRSACTRRFLPSEFGMVYTPDNIGHIPSYRWNLQAVGALEQTALEFSLILIGMFLDYWSTPRIPSRLVNTPNMRLDAENDVAIVPGDGEAPVVLTHSYDAARYTAALLDFPRWKKKYFIVGNRTTLNDAVRLAQEVKGVRFGVHYESSEPLQSGKAQFTPRLEGQAPSDEIVRSSFKAMVAALGLGLAKGDLDLDPNESLTLEFESAKPLSLSEVFKAWK